MTTLFYFYSARNPVSTCSVYVEVARSRRGFQTSSVVKNEHLGDKRGAGQLLFHPPLLPQVPETFESPSPPQTRPFRSQLGVIKRSSQGVGIISKAFMLLCSAVSIIYHASRGQAFSVGHILPFLQILSLSSSKDKPARVSPSHIHPFTTSQSPLQTTSPTRAY